MFKVSIKELRAALVNLKKVLDKEIVKIRPILGYLKISSNYDNNVTIEVSTGETRLFYEFIDSEVADADKPNSQCLPILIDFKGLEKIVKKHKTGYITFELKDEIIEIGIKNTVIRHSSMINGTDYNQCLDDYETVSLKLHSKTFMRCNNIYHFKYSEFKKALDNVIDFSGEDKFQRNLCGVFFDLEKNRLVALDGFRLAVSTFKTNKVQGNYELLHDRFIFPLQPLKLIQKLLKKNETDEITLYNSDSEDSIISMRIGRYNFMVDSPGIEFPDYEAVIPDSFNTQVVLDTKVFEESLNTFNSLLSDGDMMVFNINGTFKAENTNKADIGEIVTNIPVENKDGKDLRIAFEPNMILPGLKHLGDKIELNFVDTNAALQINNVDQDSDKYEYAQIVMPVRLRE